MAPEADHESRRLRSLDAYRGFVMLAMASGGIATFSAASDSDGGIWSLFRQVLCQQLDHAAWRGCTFWDLIQPSFMFLVGAAMPFSYARRCSLGDSGIQLFGHAIIRSFVLVLLAVFLASVGSSYTNYTFVNVLGQIGLGYTFVYLLLGCRPAYQLATALAILFAYWLFFALYPLPGRDFPYTTYGADDLQLAFRGFFAHWNKNSNAAAAFDRWFLNLFPRPSERPFLFNEGGYATSNFVPSIATMLAGVLAGELLRSTRSALAKTKVLLAAGGVCWVLGFILDFTFCPIVKRIWTPAWVFSSTGWSLGLLAVFYYVIDVAGIRRWSLPLVVVGMNSIAIYLMSQLLKPFVGSTLRTHFGQDLFDGPNGALVRGLTTLLVFWLVCFWMYRQKLFIKI